jgi:cytochrome b subunit of formate dehydrogenase
MTVFGISIFAISGIINFILLLFQFLSGLRVIKVKIKVHKTTGIILFVIATLHGIIGIFVL